MDLALVWFVVVAVPETMRFEVEAVPETFHAPKGLPDVLVSGLDAKLAKAG